MVDELIILSNGETLEVINENNVNGERTYKGELSFLKQIMNFYEDVFGEKYVPIEKMSGFKILDEGGFVFKGKESAKRLNILSGDIFGRAADPKIGELFALYVILMENPNSSNLIEFNKVWAKVQKDIPGIKRLDKTYDFITTRDVKDHWYADVFLGSFERIINITENGKPAGFIIRDMDNDVLVNLSTDNPEINSVYFMTTLTNNFKYRENYNFELNFSNSEQTKRIFKYNNKTEQLLMEYIKQPKKENASSIDCLKTFKEEIKPFINTSLKKKLKYVGLAVEEGQNKISAFFEDVNKLKYESFFKSLSSVRFDANEQFYKGHSEYLPNYCYTEELRPAEALHLYDIFESSKTRFADELKNKISEFKDEFYSDDSKFWCEIKSPNTSSFQTFSDIMTGIQANEEIHNRKNFLEETRKIKTDSGKFASILAEKLEKTKIEDFKKNEFFCENNEMNVKLNGSFELREVYDTYKQVKEWAKMPSITLKTNDMIIQEDKQLIADKSITVPKITESLKEEIKDIIFGEKHSLRINDKTDKQIITFPSRVRGTQFQLKSEEIAKKIPNADIIFINGKEEKNIKKSENTNEKLHLQTNEHLHKTR